jgi:predicted RNA polymerase sigma factor
MGQGRLYAGGLLGGLTTQEIARAFLVGEPTVAQRIVRAKRTLAEAHVAFEVPRGDPLGLRLASVLEVVYVIFNEGKSATAGDDWMRPSLGAEALRLGRILAELAPRELEVHGLVSLMEIQASRAGGAHRPVGGAGPAARPLPRKPIGRASRRSTMPSLSSRHLPSWSSIGRSRLAWRSVW